ncbi:rhodanese-like domain-containing protein [Aerococcaceae bacterium zg-BR22]|uniref:rhodanese-like domain-containing protein n=1 Tax=Aerococcaceae bacterium zg-1292 TaxID=2774330 RepID=UPI00406386CD|nr:rhodanese-like domain-containing protein [Aerococcaceae bacterium zg-BR22]
MQSISMQAFTEKVANENVSILDVRGIEKYRAGHIPGAKHYIAGETQAKLSPEITYYIICQVGVTSVRVTKALEALGFDVINVEGGMVQWQGDLAVDES